GHTAVELQEAMFERTRVFREIQAWFDDCDIVATPTLSRTALAIDHDFFAPIEIDGVTADTVRKAWYPYTLPFNLSGNPAVTLPCGWGEGGLPIGLQLIGPHLRDARLCAPPRSTRRRGPGPIAGRRRRRRCRRHGW